MNKEQMVKEICNLIIDNCQDDTSYNDNTLYDFIMYGFKGLNNMSEDELKDELKKLVIE
jgi:hypothetical protein